MTEETDSLVSEHLRHIRAKVDRIDSDLSDVKARISALEVATGQVIAMMGGLNQRMDRFDERLGRIERRLELADA